MSFIKNYGLYWKRDLVAWGARGAGNAGSLVGYAARSEEPVEFRTQAGVYVLYDGADIPSLKVNYVGQVGRARGDSLFGRLRNHRRDHLWNRWTRFSWFGVFAVGATSRLVRADVGRRYQGPLTGVIGHLEGVLITMLEPTLNKRGANWDGADQYFQDDEQPTPVDARLAALEARIRD